MLRVCIFKLPKHLNPLNLLSLLNFLTPLYLLNLLNLLNKPNNFREPSCRRNAAFGVCGGWRYP